MKIKKIGHCCLLIQTGNITILTDPGGFSTGQAEVAGVDIVLITHEHADHLHVDSLKEVLKNNPQATVVTNGGVGVQLNEARIPYELLEGTNTKEFSGVLVEAFDGKHEEIFEEVGQVQNTGYFIDNTLFYPGDSFKNPEKSVEVLALPVAGPWCRISDAIRYALSVKPQKAFPVHDGMLQEDKIGGSHNVPAQVLLEHNIEFVAMKEGDVQEF